MLEKYSISTANGRSPVALGIESKANAGSRIEKMTLLTTSVGCASDGCIRKSRRGHSSSPSSTLHHAIKRIAGPRYKSSSLASDAAVSIDLRSVRRSPDGRVEIVGLVVALAVSPEEAHP